MRGAARRQRGAVRRVGAAREFGDRHPPAHRRTHGQAGKPSAGCRGPRGRRLGSPSRRRQQRRDRRADDGQERRAAVRRPRRAQGRRDEVRPGAVGVRGRAARGAGRPVPRDAHQAAGGGAAHAGARRPQRARRAVRPDWRERSASSTTGPPRRRASGRCTARLARRPRSPSRSSTRARRRRCGRISPARPAAPAGRAAVPGLDVSRWSPSCASAWWRSSTTPSRPRTSAPSPTPSPATRGRRARGGGRRREVLVTRWIEGTPLSRVIAAGTQEERDRAGAAVGGSCSPARRGRGCCTRTRTPATSGCCRRRAARRARLRRRRPAARGAAPAAVGDDSGSRWRTGRTTSSRLMRNEGFLPPGRS